MIELIQYLEIRSSLTERSSIRQTNFRNCPNRRDISRLLQIDNHFDRSLRRIIKSTDSDPLTAVIDIDGSGSEDAGPLIRVLRDDLIIQSKANTVLDRF